MSKHKLQLEEDHSKDIPLGKSQFQPNLKSFAIRLPKINSQFEVINIGKNQLCYSRISNPIKLCFLMCYKQCYQEDCMKELFKNWINKKSSEGEPRRVQIIDEDAIHLIWKMQKAIQQKKREREIINLRNEREKIVQQMDKIKASGSTLHAQLKEVSSVRIFNNKSEEHNEQQNIIDNFIQLIKFKENKILKFERQLSQNLQKTAILQNLQQKRHPNLLLRKSINKAIKKMTRQLISESIVGIFQTDDTPVDLIQIDGKIQIEDVYVIFEQSYGIKKMKKAAIIRELGSSIYLEKLKNSHGIQPISNFFLSCHRCMNLFPQDQLFFCRQKILKKQTKSYVSSNYNHYKQSKIEGDYFSDPPESIFPYFTYNKDENGKLLCNRGFCFSCLHNYYYLNSEQFKCPYCEGLCNCRRCEMAISLVKLIAHDLSINPEIKQRNYIRSLKLFGQQKRQDVSQTFLLIYPQKRTFLFDNNERDLSRKSNKVLNKNKIIVEEHFVNNEQKNNNISMDFSEKNIDDESIQQSLYQNNSYSSQENSFGFLEESKRNSLGFNGLNHPFLCFPDESHHESI